MDLRVWRSNPGILAVPNLTFLVSLPPPSSLLALVIITVTATTFPTFFTTPAAAGLMIGPTSSNRFARETMITPEWRIAAASEVSPPVEIMALTGNSETLISESDPLRLTKRKDERGTANLEVEYYGYLTDGVAIPSKQIGPTPIQLWIRLNGVSNSYTFNILEPYTPKSQSETTNKALARVILTPSFEDAHQTSYKTYAPDLFREAQDPDGILSRWEIDITVTNKWSGRWDNRNGVQGWNYHFSL